MDCKPAGIAIGLTTDAGPSGPAKLAAKCEALQQAVGVPVFNASAADYAALSAFGASKIGVVTPFNAQVDKVVQANTEAAGFEVVHIKGTEAPSLPAICETSIADIRRVFQEVAQSDCDAILQVGTALPVVAIVGELEAELGKPIVACNAAVYWQALRGLDIDEKISGYGRLLAEF